MNRYNQTILVVEDDTQIQSFICYALKSEGFSAVTANTAQAALSKLISERIDIMLLDLGLPDFDGMENSRLICRLDRFGAFQSGFRILRAFSHEMTIYHPALTAFLLP